MDKNDSYESPPFQDRRISQASTHQSTSSLTLENERELFDMSHSKSYEKTVKKGTDNISNEIKVKSVKQKGKKKFI